MWARGLSSDHVCPDRTLSLPPIIKVNNDIFAIYFRLKEEHFKRRKVKTQ